MPEPPLANPGPEALPAPLLEPLNPTGNASISRADFAAVVRQAKALAARYYPFADSFEDLVAEMILVGLEAAPRFNGDYGARMTTWLWPRMKGRMIDVIRNRIRHRDHFETVITASRGCEPDDGLGHSLDYHPIETRVDVRLMIERLADQLRTTERLVLHQHYMVGETLKEIARCSGRSRSMVSRRHARLLRRLRRHAGVAEPGNATSKWQSPHADVEA